MVHQVSSCSGCFSLMGPIRHREVKTGPCEPVVYRWNTPVFTGLTFLFYFFGVQCTPGWHGLVDLSSFWIIVINDLKLKAIIY